jgi:hypothetical protein
LRLDFLSERDWESVRFGWHGMVLGKCVCDGRRDSEELREFELEHEPRDLIKTTLQLQNPVLRFTILDIVEQLEIASAAAVAVPVRMRRA